MPLSLKTLKEKRNTVTLDFEGEKLTFSYNPYALTPNIEAEINQASDQAAFTRSFLLIVTSWDLEDEKGKPVPLNEKALGDVPNPLLLEILRKAGEDNNPPSERRGGSFTT